MWVPTYHQKFNHNTRKKKNKRGLAHHRCLKSSVSINFMARPKPGLASYVKEITGAARRFTRVRRPALVLRVSCATPVRDLSSFWMLLEIGADS